nr:flagellar biosynthesis anti-sigma factor FlgM [Falsibacillus pallidus]
MKINPFNNSGINPYKKQAEKYEKTAQTRGMGNDKVEISTAAKEMQQSSQLIIERQAKVEELKQKVESGEYKADPKETAKAMLKFFRK